MIALALGAVFAVSCGVIGLHLEASAPTNPVFGVAAIAAAVSGAGLLGIALHVVLS